MTSAAFDPFRLLRALLEHEVAFIVIGGFAARVWGSPTVTNDLDVCYASGHANTERLAATLRSLNARLRDFDPALPFVLDGRTISLGNSFTFETEGGNLDCLATPAGTAGFDDLARNAALLDLGEGLEIHFASLDDVMRMKRAAGRKKDRIELEVLEAVKAEREKSAGE
jgi:hypothetical protein